MDGALGAAADLASVLRVLGRFRRSPLSFLDAQGIDVDRWITEGVVFLCADTKDDMAKMHILQLWQEYTPLLFTQSKRIENLFNSLLGLIAKDPTDASAMFCSQLLMTLTAILASVSAPREYPRLLTALVNKLLDYIKSTNLPTARLARGTALHCLHELECAYPGLLTIKLGLFFQLAMEDTTHNAHLYVLLFARVLANYLKHVVPTLDVLPQGFTSVIHKGVFTMPDYWSERKASKPDTAVLVLAQSGERNELWIKDVKRSMTFLLENTTIFAPAGLVEVVQLLLQTLTTMPTGPDALKQQFFRLCNSQHLAYVHLVIQLRQRLPNALFSTEDDQLLLRRIVVAFVVPNRSDEERLLVASWILNLDATLRQPLPTLLYPWRAWLYPTTFDSLRIKQAKLKLLAHCFEPAPSSLSPPLDILNVLTCVHDFRVMPTFSMQANITFDALLTFVRRYSELSHPVQRFVTNVIFEGPRFIDQLSILMERIRQTIPGTLFPLDVLRQMSTSLCECDVDDFVRHGFDYLHLLERIAKERDIDPVRPARYLLDVLRLSAVCEMGSWSFGVLMIKVARTILLSHPTSLVLHSLKDLLAHLAFYYADVDVRDQAKFLLLILTHLSRDKMLRVLQPSSSMSIDFSIDGLVAGPAATQTKVAPIQAISVAFLTLARANLPRSQLLALKRQRRAHTDDILKLDTLAQYLARVTQLQQVPTTVDLLLRYDDAVLMRKDLPVFPLRIFSLVIEFTTQVPVQGPVRVSVPYLEAAPAATELVAETLPDKFPYQYAVPLEVVLHVPSPAWFTLTAQFNNPDGASQTAPMDPIRMGFEDILLPVADETTPPDVVERLFERLWVYFGRLAESDADEAALMEQYYEEIKPLLEPGSRLLETAFESVKYLMVNGREMIRLLRERFECFLVSSPQDDVMRALFFVPPRHHVLCSFVIGPDSTVAFTRTDAWRTLMYLDGLLEALVLEIPDDQGL